jgi:hypothetical protein
MDAVVHPGEQHGSHDEDDDHEEGHQTDDDATAPRSREIGREVFKRLLCSLALLELVHLNLPHEISPPKARSWRSE